MYQIKQNWMMPKTACKNVENKCLSVINNELRKHVSKSLVASGRIIKQKQDKQKDRQITGNKKNKAIAMIRRNSPLSKNIYLTENH